MNNNLKHEPKVYILSMIFGCIAFATMNTVDKWTEIESIKDYVLAVSNTLMEALAYVIIIGALSGICYLIINLWISNSVGKISFYIKYIIVCLFAMFIIGAGISSFISSHPYGLVD